MSNPSWDDNVLEDEAYALEQFFLCLQIEDMNISVSDGHLIATDECGNVWRDNEIHDFALNECLTFGPDGKLIEGFMVNEDYLDPILKYAKLRDIHIETVG